MATNGNIGDSPEDDGCNHDDSTEHAPENFPQRLSPDVIADLATVARYARTFIESDFGEYVDRRRTIASFEQMEALERGRDDVDVKNHLVTLGFFDLSRVLLGYTRGAEITADAADDVARELATAGEEILDRLRTPDSGARAESWPDANFCVFGTWASLTIGRNVRNRFAPRRLDHTTSNAIRGAVSRLAIDVRQTNDQRLSRLLGAAQHVVFDELRAALKGLLEQTLELEQRLARHAPEPDADADEADQHRDAARILRHYASVEKQLAAWLDPPDLIGKDRSPKVARPDTDERYADLQHGLLSYFLARQIRPQDAPAPRSGPSDLDVRAEMEKARAELIFRGNLLIESYVQIKVQQVLDYSVDEIASDYFSEQIGIEESENRGAGRWRRRLNRSALKSFERRLDDVWPRFVTDQVLVARVGDEIIRLGRDLPDPPGSTSFLPPELDHIEDNWLSNLVLRFDHSFGHGVGTRSHNWRVYDDRMNWLVNLLRSRQRSPGVWNDPFTLEEEVAVRAHRDPTDRSQGVLPWMR